MKNLKYLVILLVFVSCEHVLDKDDLSSINEADVWNDYKLASAVMDNNAFAGPDWSEELSSHSDEAGLYDNNGLIQGFITADNLEGLEYWPYKTIREINTVLAEMKSSTIGDDQKMLLEGQAYFWRAYQYFEMVKRYGGVPIITTPQDIDGDIYVARNKTSECYNFIVDDLDNAISLLPDEFTGAELGKINKGVAYAFKARVLQYKASPQFNPSGDITLWNSANDASKKAYEWLSEHGYGLYSDFGDLWFNEMNEEVVFVTRFNDPERTTGRAGTARPMSMTTGKRGADQPTMELVNAFPMSDGIAIDGHDLYDPLKYWENRDPRFYKTVAYNGAVWELGGVAERIQWTYEGEATDGYGSSYGTLTGFYTPKAIELEPDQGTAPEGSVDWVEIRFAEVMMNYAETANEVGQTEIAYDILKQIRQRAGIDQGSDGMYGLETGMATEKMREVLMAERFIEFAFEGKRFWDLRRWRWLNRLNGTVRHGLISRPVDLDDLSLGFTLHDLVLDTEYAINYPDNYYFLPMKTSELEANPNLKQTNGWGDGGFDPLQ